MKTSVSFSLLWVFMFIFPFRNSPFSLYNEDKISSSFSLLLWVLKSYIKLTFRSSPFNIQWRYHPSSFSFLLWVSFMTATARTAAIWARVIITAATTTATGAVITVTVTGGGGRTSGRIWTNEKWINDYRSINMYVLFWEEWNNKALFFL